MNRATIVMYHFVRDLPNTRYPKIKGMLAQDFEEQLAYFKKYYTLVSLADCLHACYEKDASFPQNAALLTFDDGYIDHFEVVFPLLVKNRVSGCFFPPGKAVLEHKVLNVNKIHFLLASADFKLLLSDVYAALDQYRDAYNLESNAYYFDKLAHANRFDSKNVIFFKRLLQVELPEKLRDCIVDELFRRYVTEDESSFANELYMSIDQLKVMLENGMDIGSHSYDHYWLDRLTPDEQEREVDLSINFLKTIGVSTDAWAMCYPYGGYNDSLLTLLKKKNCKIGLTTRVGISNLNSENALTLERFDTNDFPKHAKAEPNLWTLKQLDIT